MPRGVYIRSEAHKEKLRELADFGRNVQIERGQIGRYIRTKEHRAAFSERVHKVDRKGEKSPRWKGDEVGYTGVHLWMARMYGKPSKCDGCGTESSGCFDWANISGKYKRERGDWKRLCRSCHMKEDGRGAAAAQIMKEARS